MYEFMLNAKFISLVMAILLSWLASILAGHPVFSLRPIIYNYAPSFACSFFVLGIFYDGSINLLDLTAGFVFEFFVLIAFTKLFFDLLKYRADIDDISTVKWLRISLVLQILVALPLITSEGFGIFSDGSRNAYLENNRAAKYLFYCGLLISAVQAGLIAQWFSGPNRNRVLVYIIIIVTFLLSTLSGSKGGVFLWIFSILVLVDYSQKRISWLSVIVGSVAILIAFSITLNVISEMLNISHVEFIELSVSRFFLNNDARALAFDMRNGREQMFELFASAFRGIFMLFGYFPKDPPIGVLLHDQLFGFSSGSGANASLIALITYYSMEGYALFAALIACFGLAIVYASVVGFRHMLHCPISKSIVTIMGLLLVQIFSQDFLAFPLLVPFACLAGLFLIVTDRKYASVQRL